MRGRLKAKWLQILAEDDAKPPSVPRAIEPFNRNLTNLPVMVQHYTPAHSAPLERICHTDPGAAPSHRMNYHMNSMSQPCNYTQTPSYPFKNHGNPAMPLPKTPISLPPNYKIPSYLDKLCGAKVEDINLQTLDDGAIFEIDSRQDRLGSHGQGRQDQALYASIDGNMNANPLCTSFEEQTTCFRKSLFQRSQGEKDNHTLFAARLPAVSPTPATTSNITSFPVSAISGRNSAVYEETGNGLALRAGRTPKPTFGNRTIQGSKKPTPSRNGANESYASLLLDTSSSTDASGSQQASSKRRILEEKRNEHGQRRKNKVQSRLRTLMSPPSGFEESINVSTHIRTRRGPLLEIEPLTSHTEPRLGSPIFSQCKTTRSMVPKQGNESMLYKTESFGMPYFDSSSLSPIDSEDAREITKARAVDTSDSGSEDDDETSASGSSFTKILSESDSEHSSLADNPDVKNEDCTEDEEVKPRRKDRNKRGRSRRQVEQAYIPDINDSKGSDDNEEEEEYKEEVLVLEQTKTTKLRKGKSKVETAYKPNESSVEDSESPIAATTRRKKIQPKAQVVQKQFVQQQKLKASKTHRTHRAGAKDGVYKPDDDTSEGDSMDDGDLIDPSGKQLQNNGSKLEQPKSSKNTQEKGDKDLTSHANTSVENEPLNDDDEENSFGDNESNQEENESDYRDEASTNEDIISISDDSVSTTIDQGDSTDNEVDGKKSTQDDGIHKADGSISQDEGSQFNVMVPEDDTPRQRSAPSMSRITSDTKFSVSKTTKMKNTSIRTTNVVSKPHKTPAPKSYMYTPSSLSKNSTKRKASGTNTLRTKKARAIVIDEEDNHELFDIVHRLSRYQERNNIDFESDEELLDSTKVIVTSINNANGSPSDVEMQDIHVDATSTPAPRQFLVPKSRKPLATIKLQGRRFDNPADRDHPMTGVNDDLENLAKFGHGNKENHAPRHDLQKMKQGRSSIQEKGQAITTDMLQAINCDDISDSERSPKISSHVHNMTHTVHGAIRRHLINQRTFPGNVRLLRNNSKLFFKCCSCQQLSQVDVQFFQDEVVWSTALCFNCYEHKCCAGCDKYEEKGYDLGLDKADDRKSIRNRWWDYENFLDTRKELFESGEY